MSRREEPLKMIDISKKEASHRVAEAYGRIKLKGDTIRAIKKGAVDKGDPLATAQIAAILGVKKTPEIIPLCHQIPITSIKVDFDIRDDSIEAGCRVEADYKTGVEMEALVGVSIALLTIWDMVKYLEKDEKGQYPTTSITEVRVVEKRKESI